MTNEYKKDSIAIGVVMKRNFLNYLQSFSPGAIVTGLTTLAFTELLFPSLISAAILLLVAGVMGTIGTFWLSLSIHADEQWLDRNRELTKKRNLNSTLENLKRNSNSEDFAAKVSKAVSDYLKD